MARAFVPFPITRTIGNLTFYMMEGRNFVRTKSSLTRRRVLYSPQFKNTRHNAGILAKASKIGSHIYSALPVWWRQGWMYRSFTGEAYTMLKKGKQEDEIKQVLLQRYVELVISKKAPGAIVTLPAQSKRAYRKSDNEYWNRKTLKSKQRKARKAQTLYHATLMGQASKMGSRLYAHLPAKYKSRSNYQYLTGCVLKLLKLEVSEEDIVAGLLPTLRQANEPAKASTQMKAVHVVKHPRGLYYFLPPFSTCQRIALTNFYGKPTTVKNSALPVYQPAPT